MRVFVLSIGVLWQPTDDDNDDDDKFLFLEELEQYLSVPITVCTLDLNPSNSLLQVLTQRTRIRVCRNRSLA